MCLFSTWYLVSVWGRFSTYYYKIKYIDEELCPCSGLGCRCELAVPPLTAAEQDFGSSVVLRGSYKHCSGLGEIPAKNELFFCTSHNCMSVLLTVMGILNSCPSQHKLNLYFHNLLQQ